MMRSKIFLFFAFFLITLVFGSIPTEAQKIRTVFSKLPGTSLAPEAASASITQCRNTDSPRCTTVGGNSGWVSGQAGPPHAMWAEDDFVPYRMELSGLAGAGEQHVLVIGYDILKGTKHAIDYLGTYNATEGTANPCAGVTGTHCTGNPADADTFAIPKDAVTVHGFNNPNTNLPIQQEDGVFTIWGGDITAVSYLPYTNGEERLIQVTFTANVSNPVVAWGGHIAWIGDWGAGNSASAIEGAPYHMRLGSFDGTGGNQDLALKSDAVIPSGAVVIIKRVESFNGDTADVFFDFTASAFFNPLAFQLKDVNDNSLDRKGSEAITLFGPANAITVTEGPSTSFDLAEITCTESGANAVADSTGDVITRTATIIVQLGEVTTCTFKNALTQATAANASVSGRVTDRYGRAISGAQLTIVNATTGEMSVASTNSFGYYTFNDLPVGDFYAMSVMHRRYVFVNQTVSFSLDDNLTGMDFQASR